MKGLPELPVRPVDPGWLALREPADTRARDGAADVILPMLLTRLARQMRQVRQESGQGGARPAEQPLRVVDLGAGTGANPRWLAPRLGDPAGQHWTLVDHDPRLATWAPVRTTSVRADVGELAGLLAGLQRTDGPWGAGGAGLVTAAALLDVLKRRQLRAIADAVVTARVPALFSLSVTGAVRLDPADPRDTELAAAFDAHQRRAGRPGPDAGAEMAGLFRDRGWQVVEAPSPWLLRADHEPALVAAWLDGRAEAGLEQRPDLAAPAAEWLAERKAQVSRGSLTVMVDHLEVLALPR